MAKAARIVIGSKIVDNDPRSVKNNAGKPRILTIRAVDSTGTVKVEDANGKKFTVKASRIHGDTKPRHNGYNPYQSKPSVGHDIPKGDGYHGAESPR